jgi:hypothetical protein
MKIQGFVTEAQYSEAGIVSVDDGRAKPKDQRPVHQNRAVLLNTELNLQRFEIPDPLLAPVGRDASATLRKNLKRKEAEDLKTFRANQKQARVDTLEAAKKDRAELKKAATLASAVARARGK